MVFDEGEVARLARLARIDLSEAEKAALPAELARIAHEFEGLRARAGALPEAPERAAQPARADEVAPEGSAADVIAQAPARDASGRVVVGRG